MSAEFQRGSRGDGLAQFLAGSIEAGELSKAINEETAAAVIHASPAKKAPAKKAPAKKAPVKAPQGTQTKTCKPTRNPCCKPLGEEKPGGGGKAKATLRDKTCAPTLAVCCNPPKDTKAAGCKLQATQAKTCKPTRNPCCKGGLLEATKEKTCKPTRSPCCRPPAGKKAHGRGEDFLGGSPAGRLFI